MKRFPSIDVVRDAVRQFPPPDRYKFHAETGVKPHWIWRFMSNQPDTREPKYSHIVALVAYLERDCNVVFDETGYRQVIKSA